MIISVEEEKIELRNKIHQLKKKFNGAELRKKSEIIFNKIEKLDVFRVSGTVMAYWSLDDEVFTHEFILKWGPVKKILLPVIDGHRLRVRQFTEISNLKKKGRLGLFEPTGEYFPDTQGIDIVIVPGMAFDTENHRLGRGKAYYDIFLAGRSTTKIGVCFDFQFFDKIPYTASDIEMDLVITD
jgi:5-formyltetrahydrofolate cyclo-ligase